MLEFLTTPQGIALLAICAIIAALIAPLISPSGITNLWYRLQGKRVVLTDRERSRFPFLALSISDFDKAEKVADLSLDLDIKYAERLPPEEYKVTMQRWRDALNDPQHPYLLLTGVSGLGKTREAIELLRRLATETAGQGELTILMPQPDMDVPLDFPDELNINLRNIVLFIDDVHKFVLLGRSGRQAEFLDRLQNVIKSFQDLKYGLFRVVCTARSEPNLYAIINPAHTMWNEFYKEEVPRLAENQVPLVADTLSTYFNISIDSLVKDVLKKRNDGTFQSLIYFFKSEKITGKNYISQEVAQLGFLGACKQTWQRHYAQSIQPFPEMQAVVDALGLLHKVKAPCYSSLVIEIGARSLNNRKPLWWRRRMISQALHKLRIWFPERDGIILAHDASVEDSGNLDKISSIVASFRHLLRKLRVNEVDPFFNIVYNFLAYLRFESYFELELELAKELVRIFPTSAFARSQLAHALAAMGYLRKGLKEVDEALRLDPSVLDFYTIKGDLLHEFGDFRRAEASFITVLRMSTRDDYSVPYFLYEYAILLDTINALDQAELCYKRILELDPSYVSARCGLAHIYLKKKRINEAQQEAAQAFETEPKTDYGKKNVATLYRYFGRPEKTVEILTALHNSTFRNVSGVQASINHQIALSYFQMGDIQSAIKHAKQCVSVSRTMLKRDPHNVWVISDLIEAYVLLNYATEARRYTKRLFTMCAHKEFVIGFFEKIEELSTMGINPKLCQALIDLGRITPRVEIRPTELELAWLLRLRGNLLNQVEDENLQMGTKQSLLDTLRSAGSLNRLRKQAEQLQKSLVFSRIIVINENIGLLIALTGTQRVETFKLQGEDRNDLLALLRV